METGVLIKKMIFQGVLFLRMIVRTIGHPPYMFAYMLGVIGSVFGTLTHYGHGPAPVLF